MPAGVEFRGAAFPGDHVITRLDIHTRTAVLDGRSFGPAGAYEKIVGTLHFAADPSHALTRRIVDIHLAPTDRAGRVRFSGDFYLLRPVRAQEWKRAASARCAQPGPQSRARHVQQRAAGP
jgi:hypothetical protein